MSKLHDLMLKKLKEGKTSEKGSKKQMAKMAVLKEIADMMKSATGDKLKGMKKVTVAAPTNEGLQEGLEKAGEILEEKEETEGSESDLDKLKQLIKDKEDTNSEE